jgi:hypothetical protein
LNLGHWYPFLPVYTTETGWLAYSPNLVGEHTVPEIADFDLELVLLHAPEEIQVAASGPIRKVENRFSLTARASRNLTLSMSPHFRIFETRVGATRVISYAFPETPAAGEAALLATAQALELFNPIFGTYPHPTLSVVAGNFPDGMEFDGLFFISQEYHQAFDGSPQNILTFLAVHETAHQWWYGRVASNQAIEPWLDEALCTYSERIFYENQYPGLLEWWWSFRVMFYDPKPGSLGDTIYQYGSFRPYVNNIYLSGAVFMENLRASVGEEVFFNGLKSYATEYRNGFATTEDFFSIFEESAPTQIQGLRETYFSP